MMAAAQHPQTASVSVDWDAREDQVRVNRALVESSETVKALFGDAVGPCWGDFYCTNNRIRGRFYATTHGILFYTNLLGFERRLCLLFREVEDMTLFKTTSIAVTMVDCETYIFKSFNDREQVLHLLNALRSIGNKSPSLNNSQGELNTSGEETSNLTGADVLSTPEPLGGNGSFSNPLLSLPTGNRFGGNRKRAVSDSFVRTRSSSFSASLTAGTSEHFPARRLTLSEVDTVDALSLPRQVFTPSFPTEMDSVGLEETVLNCSLDRFLQLFINDDAKYSLSKHQSENIKDHDVTASPWKDGESGLKTRTLSFVHPIKNSTGFGPDSASTHREQTLRVFPRQGLTLDNTTRVEGIPAADSFNVRDRWVLECMANDTKVRLKTRYAIRFTKRTLLKPLIQKSIRKETKEWWESYQSVLKSATAEVASEKRAIGSDIVEGPKSVLPNENIIRDLVRFKRSLTLLLVSCFLLILSLHAYLILELVSLRETVAQLDLHIAQIVERNVGSIA